MRKPLVQLVVDLQPLCACIWAYWAGVERGNFDAARSRTERRKAFAWLVIFAGLAVLYAISSVGNLRNS